MIRKNILYSCAVAMATLLVLDPGLANDRGQNKGGKGRRDSGASRQRNATSSSQRTRQKNTREPSPSQRRAAEPAKPIRRTDVLAPNKNRPADKTLGKGRGTNRPSLDLRQFERSKTGHKTSKNSFLNSHRSRLQGAKKNRDPQPGDRPRAGSGRNHNHHHHHSRHHHHRGHYWFGFGAPYYFAPVPSTGLGFSYWSPGFAISYYRSPYWYGRFGYQRVLTYPLTPSTAIYVEPGSNSASSTTVGTPEAAPTAVGSPEVVADSASNEPTTDYAAAGENLFRSGDYEGAIKAWRHALVDDPEDGLLLMMISQALFEVGRYDEAAGACQQAMLLLPEEEWGIVISNFRQLYGNSNDYVAELKSLEKAVQEKPDSPALRFLVGFHYGYLGYPQQAARELEQLANIAPDDHLGRRLLELMAPSAPKPSAVTPAN